jgi:prevent-host-death family protein
MRYSSQVKPISYLKANAAEVLTELAEQRTPLVITQNGEAKAVLQDVASFEQTQETLALLKILALGNQDVEAGRVVGVEDVVARLRTKRVTSRVTSLVSGNAKNLTRARAKTSKQ